jgi:hypothetical protein
MALANALLGLIAQQNTILHTRLYSAETVPIENWLVNQRVSSFKKAVKSIS